MGDACRAGFEASHRVYRRSVDRQPDPDNRRRLALRLTDEGRQRLHSPPATDASLEGRIGKLAHSELRALERGFEILERLPR